MIIWGRMGTSSLSCATRAISGAVLAWTLGGVAGCSDRPTTPPASTSIATSASAPADPEASADASASAALASASAPAAPLGPPRAIDMHVDTPWQVRFKGKPIDVPGTGQAAIDAIQKGKYGGIVYPIYIADHLHDNKPTIKDADLIFDTIDRIVEKHSNVLWPHTKGPTPADKITAYVSIEGAGAFAADIKQIDRFIARGVIFVGPVHWHDDDLATAATGEDGKKRGLSKLGKQFCERVYAAGGIVDVSHMSDKSFADLVPIAEKYGAPIVATHSNARAIADHVRNLTDDQLRTIKKTGGVAGLNFYDKYVRVKGTASVDDLVAHAKHMIEVAGVESIGIGTDFDGGTPPPDLPDAGHMQELAEALKKAGVSEADVHKIFGENTKRVIAWSDRKKASLASDAAKDAAGAR
ncbi:MAG: membrane dipeptidase [Myxococcales bacterium]|nr:membrane dipeptidase [Myxococcales bacterium]